MDRLLSLNASNIKIKGIRAKSVAFYLLLCYSFNARSKGVKLWQNVM
jgi:hypothetical protein